MIPINSVGGLRSGLYPLIQSCGKQALYPDGLLLWLAKSLDCGVRPLARDTDSPEHPRTESSPWWIGVSHQPSPLITMIQRHGSSHSTVASQGEHVGGDRVKKGSRLCRNTGCVCRPIRRHKRWHTSCSINVLCIHTRPASWHAYTFWHPDPGPYVKSDLADLWLWLLLSGPSPERSFRSSPVSLLLCYLTSKRCEEDLGLNKLDMSLDVIINHSTQNLWCEYIIRMDALCYQTWRCSHILFRLFTEIS